MTERPGNPAIAEVERLVTRLEAAEEPAMAAEARELVRGVLAFHREGLERIIEIVRASSNETNDAADKPIDRIARDPVASALLVLHGLHPHSIEARTRSAVEKLRVTHTSLELVDIREGTIYLRLGSMGGIQPLISKIIEAELAEAVPDAVSVSFIEPAQPLLQIRRKEAST